MSENGLSLKVLEAYTRDVGRGVARIDYDSMGYSKCINWVMLSN